jgi:hypothetical protein
MRVKCVSLAIVLLFILTTYAFSAQEGLVGYWKFDEGKGDIASDSSGNKNDGKLVRAPVWVDGKFGKALKFDAALRQKVEVPHSDNLAKIASALTIEAWVNPANFSAWISFGVKGDITYGIFINTSAAVRFHYSGGSTLDTPVNSIKANEWTHIAGTYDGKVVKIYLNGVSKAEVNATAPIPANTATFVIGGTQDSRDWFVGMIDEYKLYSRGLTADEVKKSMSGPETSVGYTDKLASTWGSMKSDI